MVTFYTSLLLQKQVSSREFLGVLGVFPRKRTFNLLFIEIKVFEQLFLEKEV